jgi:hypothetical protein
VRGSFDVPAQIHPHTLAGTQKTFLAAEEQKNCPAVAEGRAEGFAEGPAVASAEQSACLSGDSAGHFHGDFRQVELTSDAVFDDRNLKWFQQPAVRLLSCLPLIGQ